MSSHLYSPGDTYKARIHQIEQTPSGVMLVWLSLVDEFEHTHRPGQYLNLLLGKEWSYFSIASLPATHGLIELHIHTGVQEKVQFLLDAFTSQTLVSLQYPFGEVRRPEHLAKSVFLSRGTGFAPVKALMESVLARNEDREILFCWEYEKLHDLYFEKWLFSILKKHPAVTCCLFLTEQGSSQNQTGDWQHPRLSVHFETIVDFLSENTMPIETQNTWYYLCASPQRVYRWVDILESKGIAIDHIGSDVFEYAPR